MKLAPSLHRIGNDVIASYLISQPDGITIIDAGLPGHWSDLQRELKSMGRPLCDIKGVILTHGDSDHLGFAERLRRNHGIPVFIHEADADRAMGGKKPKVAWPPFRIPQLVQFLAYTLKKGGIRTNWLREVSKLQGGESLDLPGSPTIIPLPGHSPGSIAIYSASVNAIFVGDGLTTRHVLTGEGGPQAAPFSDDVEQSISSLENLKHTKAKWVLPGHGTPWNDGIENLISTLSDKPR